MKPNSRSRFFIGSLLILFLAVVPAAAQEVRSGQTPGGAFYRMAVPAVWNGSLVIWNHGFSLSPIEPVPAEETELIELLAGPFGYAVAASSYQQRGWALFKSNQDLEETVAVFEAEFGVPSEIILVGGSLGGIVTAAAIEAADLGNVTGALTFCGAVAGSRNWDAALDVRLLYDVICSQKKYRIAGGAKGLEKNSKVTPDEVASKVNACLGVDKAAGKRNKKQRKRLQRFLELTELPVSFVQTVMGYATFAMSDLVYDKGKMKGKQGAGNMNVDYGDPEINEKIERFKPKAAKARRLARNYTPSGKVGDVKIVSMHTDKDGLVIVENQGEWADVVPAENLTAAVVIEEQPTHCGFSQGELVAGWESLRNWIDGGPQPTAQDLQDTCLVFEPLVGGPCRIDPDFVIPDMDGRVRPRG